MDITRLEEKFWWRILKILYIFVYLIAIIFLIKSSLPLIGTYRELTEENENLAKLEKIVPDYKDRLGKARNAGVIQGVLQEFKIYNDLENIVGGKLPLLAVYNDVADYKNWIFQAFLIFLFLAIAYVLVVEFCRTLLLYIILGKDWKKIFFWWYHVSQ